MCAVELSGVCECVVFFCFCCVSCVCIWKSICIYYICGISGMDYVGGVVYSREITFVLSKLLHYILYLIITVKIISS